jgi:hypothetical protein
VHREPSEGGPVSGNSKTGSVKQFFETSRMKTLAFARKTAPIGTVPRSFTRAVTTQKRAGSEYAAAIQIAADGSVIVAYTYQAHSGLLGNDQGQQPCQHDLNFGLMRISITATSCPRT